MAKRKVHLRNKSDGYPECTTSINASVWDMTDKASEVTCLQCRRSYYFIRRKREEEEEERERYKQKYPLFIGVGMLTVGGRGV